ncbi:hypothetical protein SO802_033605 [Lithocarpus litseifolius]|uniref:ADP-ribosyl cyclase/cyclic ADP-ribose hydrolase n=1 Tax=Lithocarpus litseifolius TaxID=425828 RepID=A0AAW2BDI2_9ROSI
MDEIRLTTFQNIVLPNLDQLSLVILVVLLYLAASSSFRREEEEEKKEKESKWKYDVFISFRGEIRCGFSDHLLAALKGESIRTFRDDENLPKGEVIGPELLKAIRTSRIAIVVFSKNYATSDWCLNELVEILSCKRRLNQKVLPIFLRVPPSDVRGQKGKFGKPLPQADERKMKRWKTALTKAGALAGLELKPNRREALFIKDIVMHISEMLNEISAVAV